MGVKKGLINKISWTGSKIESWPSDLHSLSRYQTLEDEGFGMLADKNDSNKFDESDSIVCPDGTVFTPTEISDYWSRRGGYSSSNPDDVKMHKARVYYMGFRGEQIII